MMYNVKDNAETTLQVGLSSTANTVVVALGTGTLFPEAPFIAVLNKRDNNGAITKSEKVEVTVKDGDQFTVNRGFEDTTPMDFNSGDYISLFVLSRHINDLNGAINTNKSSINSLTTRVTTAEKNIDELQKAGSICALEKRIPVGEIYSSSDSTYLQHLPIASNCGSIAYAVGDVAARTTLHIQRIGSGVASNTLTMKVRSVGSPTTKLVCKIQQGSVISVSSTEYAWYGNGTNIATAELAYTNFSANWNTVTFTFDNSFGGTEGQLLDIVVSQSDDIVNATNYYEIAIDSTQYGEGLRLISVNGTSRVYTKLMPYAYSVGFSGCVLAKEKTANYTGTSAIIQNYQQFSGYTSSGYGTVTYTPNSLSISTTFLRWKVIPTATNRLQTTMVVGSTTVISREYLTEHSGEITKGSSDTVVFSGYKNSGGSSNFGTVLDFYWFIEQTVNIPYRTDKPLVKPASVKTVGNMVDVTLFGMIGSDWWSGGYE